MPDSGLPAPCRPVARLKKRADFKALSNGSKQVTRSFVLVTKPFCTSTGCRIGFTVTKKLGGAVIRNRIRRRLKEACRIVFPEMAREGHDYVLIARPPAFDQPFSALQEELRSALKRLHKGDAAA